MIDKRDLKYYIHLVNKFVTTLSLNDKKNFFSRESNLIRDNANEELKFFNDRNYIANYKESNICEACGCDNEEAIYIILEYKKFISSAKEKELLDLAKIYNSRETIKEANEEPIDIEEEFLI